MEQGMNDTLKVAGRIGAELGAAKAEVERLRLALQAIGRRNDSPARFDAEFDRIIRAALSQQAEPAEPAPAQDELEAFKRALHNQKVFKLSSATIDAAEWAWFARPAQTEHQPVAEIVRCQPYEDGSPNPNNSVEWLGSNAENDFQAGTKLYAAPIAQTAQEAEQSGLVTESMRNAAIAEYGRYDGDFADFADSVIRAALSAQGDDRA
jgi:hypothetical protein